MQAEATAIKLLVCPRCEARPGERCVTVNGKPVPGAPHASRLTPLREAFDAGYEAGRDDAESGSP